MTSPADSSSAGVPGRFVVGIDLGTTNSAVCYVDTAESSWRVRTFAVPQLVAPGQVESRETLPSFHFQPASGELAARASGTAGLEPAGETGGAAYVVGVLAREQGRLTPGRLIDSAKSWLCHSGVDRTAPLLPWHGEADVEQISPVEASARYLRHIRDAWNASRPRFPLAEQDVVITLPASFDEIARQLTVEAARVAGLPRVAFIEEPLAAFYAWLHAHEGDWSAHIAAGQMILVCDIGGGTTDFTLIRVRRKGSAGPDAARAGGQPGELPGGDEPEAALPPQRIQTAESDLEFQRVAVGEHLILGGDNLDLALAHHLERRLLGEGKLEPRPWTVLLGTCRHVKETLLSPDAPESVVVHVPAGGARLIGGAMQVEVGREEVRQLFVDGFLPECTLADKPQERRSGFQEFALPYAPDPGITRYLAAFLTRHRHEGEPARAALKPDAVLFNGGFFASPVLRERLLSVLCGWFSTHEATWRPHVLENERLDLAVAQGAACYGMVRRGQGLRISAGLPRTYYVGVEADPPAAVCLVPAGLEAGQTVALSDRPFELLLGEPVVFPLYVSSTRLTDAPGQVLPVDAEQLSALPPILTVLRTSRTGQRGRITVALHARLTEIGTLELWCGEVGGRRSWQLQFDVRSATETDRAAHTGLAERSGVLDEETVASCQELIRATFGPGGHESPGGLPKRIAAALDLPRGDWPPTLLRTLWATLLETEAGRRRTPEHEARWLNLAGFALRPGFGLAADDWRTAETWRVLHGKLVHATATCQAEWWVLWRRVAGGLTAGQQQALATPLLGAIRQRHRQLTTGAGRGAEFAPNVHVEAEVWRMLGALERLDLSTKIELGSMIVDLLPKRRMQALRPALQWALGRIGARVPTYGPLNRVPPPEAVAAWLDALLVAEADAHTPLTVMQLARRTEDRYRDIAPALRQLVLDWLERYDAPAHLRELVERAGSLDSAEQALIFGESLPIGLRIA